jgi:hypothetical protein
MNAAITPDQGFVMSNHHDWVSIAVAQHDAKKPYAPENGCPLKFKIGDDVVFTNEAGLKFRYQITGFYRPETKCAQYARGARYYVNSDSPWFPVSESELCHGVSATP